MSKENITKNISIDGPAASGKTSLGEELSKRINYKFLDTGLMYRFVAYQSIIRNVHSSNEELVVNISKKLEISCFDLQYGQVHLNSKNVTSKLKERRVDRRVSEIAKYSNVRKILVNHQRNIALRNNLVMVGRDIGTVVLKKAPVKIFLTASIEVRARRRYIEFVKQDRSATFEDVKEQLISRDDVDSKRNDSPLMPDKDAFIINTDNIEIDDVVNQILSRVK